MREDRSDTPDIKVEGREALDPAKEIEEIQNQSDRISIIYAGEAEHHPFEVKEGVKMGKNKSVKTDAKITTSAVKSKKAVSERSRAVILDELNRNLRRFMLLLPLVIIAMLVAAIIIQLTVLSAAGIQTRQYIDEADKLTADLNDRFDEVNDRYVAERVTALLGQNDLYVYTNSLWDYELTVNGVSVDDMEITVKASGGKVVVVLDEVRKDNPLPDAIVNVGSVTRGDAQDKMEMHIGVKSGAESGAGSGVVPVVTQDGLKKTYTFEVGGVSKGDRVVITISDQLGAKIGIPFNEVEVLVG